MSAQHACLCCQAVTAVRPTFATSCAPPQKLLNEFSLAYMLADFCFFLLPFTPTGEARCLPLLAPTAAQANPALRFLV